MTETLPTALGAEFSADRQYRYLLWRVWSEAAPPLGWVMLNPSTADETRDDPTILRCVSRARQHGFGGILVANLYAWRAVNPRDLRPRQYPVGPDNDAALLRLAALCGTVVCAWGVHAQDRRAMQAMELLLAAPGRPQLVHLGLTKGGAPRHPLMLAYATPFQDFETPQNSRKETTI